MTVTVRVPTILRTYTGGVSEVAALSGRVEGGVIEMSPMFVTAGSGLVRADGYPPHEHRFTRAGFDLPAILSPARVA